MRYFGKSAIVLTAVFVAGSVGAGAAGAGTGDDHGSGSGAARPVTWTIEAAACSEVAPGTVVTGEGMLTSRVKETTRRGVTRRRVVEHAEGTARDQAGNSYRWVYDNSLVVRNSAATPALFAGEMVDRFTLTGGPIALDNGFEATYVEDAGAGTFGLYPSSSFGDPFNFPSGPNRCDPL